MLELVIRRADVVTALERFSCDMGVRCHRIVSLAENWPEAGAEIDAEGLLTLAGGVDSHCRLDQPLHAS